MKIGVDAGCLGITDERLKVGVYTVVKNMLLELSKLDKKNQYYLYSFYPIEKSLLKKLNNNMKNVVVRPAVGWLKIALPLRLLFDNVGIFLGANQAMPIKFPGSSYKTVGIFYDIAFEKYPDAYSYAASVDKHKKNSFQLAKNAEKIIAISHSTKKDIENIYHVNAQKISVAYPGIQTLHSVNVYKHNNPYFLFVGAFKKSKNIPLLLQSFVRFLKDTKANYDLLLVGGDKWRDPEIENTLNTVSESFRKRIHFLQFVSTQELSALYKGAYAFVSPSLHEGFGLPFLEAQSVGVPVIGSDRGSLPEVIGKSAILINPKNSNMLAGAFRKITSNKNLYKKLSFAGRKNAKKYSWKLFAKEVQSAIESLA